MLKYDLISLFFGQIFKRDLLVLACETLIDILTLSKLKKYPTQLTVFLRKLSTLKETWVQSLQNKDDEACHALCQLIAKFSEYHSKFIYCEQEAGYHYLQLLLDCTNHPSLSVIEFGSHSR
jgi:uncharacterized membrane protein